MVYLVIKYDICLRQCCSMRQLIELPLEEGGSTTTSKTYLLL